MKIYRLLLQILFALMLCTGPAHASPFLYIDDDQGNLGTVDVATGIVHVIGHMAQTMTDIALDPGGNLFGITFTDLYSIDKSTGITTLIGSLGINDANALVFASDGALYAAGFVGTQLYSINKSTGHANAIGNIGAGFRSSGDMAFNGGNLYLAAIGDQLVKIDLTNPINSRAIGNMGFLNVYGLATGNDGVLYGNAGTQIFSINTATGAGTFILDYRGQGLTNTNGSTISDNTTLPPPRVAIVYLLLHGTASGPGTWNDLVKHRFGNNCPVTRLGEAITQKSVCYRHEFADVPVDQIWRNGDGSTFDFLGTEVGVVVKKIEEIMRPKAIILVGHSRGGLAARAYLQEITEQPPYKLGLLTIGTPHQGTPLGRAQHWLLDHNYTPGKILDKIAPNKVYPLQSILFSPSARYQATAHDVNGIPVRLLKISDAIWQLNDGADRLDDWVSTFGQIHSRNLRLGENVLGGLLDNGSIYGKFLIPGDFTVLRRYVLENIGRFNRLGNWKCKSADRNINNWACNGDGIAPTISQRLTRLPGFSRGNKPLHSIALTRVSHADVIGANDGETGRFIPISKVLRDMRNDLK